MKALIFITCFVGLALGSVAPVHAVDPYVDTGLTVATPPPDADLVLVREKFYGAGGLDLSAYGIAGGPHDYIQSIYVRLYVDGTPAEDSFSGLIVLPDSVTVLGIITNENDLGGSAEDGVFTATDSLFAVGTNPDAYSEDDRGFETTGSNNEFVGFINSSTIAFGLNVSTGMDDFRVIIDYGNSFPADLSFDLLAVDVGTLGGVEPFNGIHVGDTTNTAVFGSGDYGETRSLLEIPLTSVTPAIPGEALPFQPEESLFIARDTAGQTQIDSFDMDLEFPLPGMFALDNNVSNPRGITDHENGNLYCVGRDGGFGTMNPDTRDVTTVLMANLPGNVIDVTNLPGDSDVFGIRNTSGDTQIDRIDPTVPIVTQSLGIVGPTSPVAICDGTDGKLYVLDSNGKLGWTFPDSSGAGWIDLNQPTGTYDGMTGRMGSQLLYLLRNTSGDTKIDVFNTVTTTVTFDLATMPLPANPSDITDGPNDLLYVIGDGNAGNPTAFSAVDPINGSTLAIFDLLDFSGVYRTLTGYNAQVTSVPGDTPRAEFRHFAWPNPFRSAQVEIRYRLENPARVRAQVLDVQGRLVRELDYDLRGGGWHTLYWDGRNDHGRLLPTGTYFYRIAAGEALVSGKLVMMR